MISALLPGCRYGRATPSLRNAQAATEAPSTGRGSTYRNRNGVSTKPATSLSPRANKFANVGVPTRKIDCKDTQYVSEVPGMIALIGNCQIHRLQYVMQVNEVPDYLFLANTELLGLGFDINSILDTITKSDIVVAQPIMNPNHDLYYKNLLSLNNNIVFAPYIFIDGVFSLSCTAALTGHIYGQDAVIDLIKEDGLDKTVNRFRSGNIDFSNRTRFSKSIAELKKREHEICSISISDVIISEYKNKQLFTTHNHPSPWLFDIYCQRIFNKIGIKYKTMDSMNYHDKVVYTFDRNVHTFSPYDVLNLDLSYAWEDQWFGDGVNIMTSLASRSEVSS